jgi:hypothetical protein
MICHALNREARKYYRTYALTKSRKYDQANLDSHQRDLVMRKRSKPSTAHCNCNLYTLFLLAEPKYVSCVRLGTILEELSHDRINRFLLPIHSRRPI